MSAGAREVDFSDVSGLAELLQRLTGVVIPEHKSYLFEQRLRRVNETFGIGSIGELRRRVDSEAEVRHAFVHALTTHETSFFRDVHPFLALRNDVLPSMLSRVAARKRAGLLPRPFTVWSAACSSGKEAYTVAMLLDEVLGANPQFGLNPDRIRILGTDISEPVVGQAKTGVFSEGEGLRGLPASYRERYLEAGNAEYRVCRLLRRRCTFRALDLTRPFTVGPFDLVLCRNVLIYFDAPTRGQVVRRIRETMSADGEMMLGASENLESGGAGGFELRTVGRTRLYKKV